MRKFVLALLLLSSLTWAQRFPFFGHDHERAALHEKLTRLAETRKTLGLPEEQSASAKELDSLTARTELKRNRPPVPQQRGKAKTTVGENTWPPPPQVFAHGDQEPSLGEVARKYRAQKRPATQK